MVLATEEAPVPKAQLYWLMLSGLGTLDVLFRTIFAPIQAFTGVKVAVGSVLTLTAIVELSRQLLALVAFNSTV